MPKTPEALTTMPPAAAQALRALGENLAIARVRRRESQRAWARRLGCSVPTLIRMERGEADYLAVERQLRLERAHDAFRLAKAVLLALELEVGDGHTLRSEGCDNGARLTWRDDFVFQSLKGDQRCVEAAEMMDRRARFVDRPPLRQRRDETIQVAAFELVRIAGESLEVADPVIVRSRLEYVVKGQCREHREAARTSAPDGGAVAIDKPPGDDVLDGGDHVARVYDSPIAVEALAVSASEAAAPA